MKKFYLSLVLIFILAWECYSQPSASSNSPVCTGNTLSFSSSGGSSYHWTGPNGFSSNLEYPYITNVMAANTGTYTVLITGSSTYTLTTSVVVNTFPPTAYATSNSPICDNQSLNLYSSTTGNPTYYWTGPYSFYSYQQNPTINNTSTAMSGTYTLTVDNGCASTSTTTAVIINPTPFRSISFGSPLCTGDNLYIRNYSTGAVSYIWTGPNGFTSTQYSVIISNVTAANSGTYLLTNTSAYGCSDTISATIHVSSNYFATASNNSPVCWGSTLNLSSSGGVSYIWYGPPSYLNFSFAQNTSISNVQPSQAGVYYVRVTDAYGCSELDSTQVTVNSASLNLKFFIQGYYINGGTLKKVLHNEGVDTNSSSTNVDTVMVELHNATSPYAVAESYKGVLQTNGTLVCTYSCNVTGHSYYIAVRHRNTIQTWSAAPIAFTATTNYDFTTAATKAYGNNMIQMQAGKWAFYTGDINQDENVDLQDFPTLDYGIAHGFSGYYASDLNGDGNVDLVDFPTMDANIILGIFSMHP